jgi:hypothetical protein
VEYEWSMREDSRTAPGTVRWIFTASYVQRPPRASSDSVLPLHLTVSGADSLFVGSCGAST